MADDDPTLPSGPSAQDSAILELQRLRETVARHERKLSLLFNQAPVGVIEWDLGFRAVEWNPTAERIFGYTREEALGRHASDLVVPEPVRPHVDGVWAQLLSRRDVVQSLNENMTKDGRTIVCEWYNTTLVNRGGEVTGVTSLVFDVTQRHRADQELRRREREQAATIEQLSAPVIDVWEGILALPVIGAVDTERASRITESLLHAIVAREASYTLIDLTGAIALDASIAEHLRRMVRAAELLGTICVVSGLSPELSRLLTEEGAELEVRSFATLRAALAYAIEAMGARSRRA